MQPEHVQFFPSESSFGSQVSMADSRYIDFTRELIRQVSTVFTTLENQLKPVESQIDKEHVKHAIGRGRLLLNSNISEHMANLKKVQSSEEQLNSLSESSHRLDKLLKDYADYQAGTMKYRDFYSLYSNSREIVTRKSEKVKSGATNEFIDLQNRNVLERFEPDIVANNFLKKPEYQQVNLGLQPDIVRVNYNYDRASNSNSRALPVSGESKELILARDELIKMQKINQSLTQEYELNLIREKKFAEQRILEILKNDDQKGNESLKLQLKTTHNLYLQQLKAHQELISVHNSSKGQIVELQEEIRLLREDLERHERLQTSFYDEENEVYEKSIYSAENGEQPKRLQKTIRNLKNERQMLKLQLKKQRQAHYKAQYGLAEEERRELEKTKKLLDKKNEQIKDLYLSLDRLRVQNIRLGKEGTMSIRLAEGLKEEQEILLSKVKKVSLASIGQIPQESYKTSARQTKENKCYISQYQGDGIQGYSYYERFTKEFQIRFKRACLRDKQLLYHQNQTEIGVITSFAQPNVLTLLMHVSNEGKEDLRQLKAKIMTGNQNFVQCEACSQVIDTNKQIKFPVTVKLSYYPIGPIVLLLEGLRGTNKQQFRLLLPAHIFKTIIFQPRTSNISNPVTHSVESERKIVKTFKDLYTYFRLPISDNPCIRITGFHKHSHTLFALDVVHADKVVELSHQHLQGNEYLTQYFAKTLVFLLSKG